MSSEWCTIESDPAVFTELIEKFGVKGVQVEELYDLEDVTFQQLQPIYGLIFLFKWQPVGSESVPSSVDVPGLFFAKQVISNACATQAIVSILLNSPSIDVGEELKSFRSFTLELPPDMRGLSLASSECIRVAHNSFARPEHFELDESKLASDDDDAFHFISYIPFQGQLYELDGLKPGPVCIGACTEDDWLSKARPAIQERIQQYSQSEIRFNLMALIRNRGEALQERIDKMQRRMELAQSRLDPTSSSMELDGEDLQLPTDTSELSVAISAMENEMQNLRADLETEKAKRLRWKEENTRRKHNYIPFVFSLLQKLAEKGKLADLVEKGKEKRKERFEEAQRRKMAKPANDASS